jgi:peroxiredoxin
MNRSVLLLLALIAGPVVSSPARTETNQTMANHELASMDGKKMTLSSLRGQVVVVNFWATWCAPCRKELAVFDGWNREWGNRGARVVAISIDRDARKARRFAEDMGLSLLVVHDGPDGLARSLDLPSVPCTYLLDRDGNVLSIVKSSNADELAALKAKVESMTRGPQSAGMGAGSNGDSR